MDFYFMLTVFVIGVVSSFVSGMIGIGGAIINYPMLLYIPVFIGTGHFSSHQVSSITAIQVLVVTVSGLLAYRKGNYLNKTLIAFMGMSILIGSLFGGILSSHMSENSINIVYGMLAIIAVVLIFAPKKFVEDVPLITLTFNKWLASALALVVGIGAGIVGAGGSFLLVPIMLVILRIPTRVTIASSLAITFISSVGAVAGKVATGHIFIVPSLLIVVASMIASPLGVKVGKKMNTKLLQILMGLLILLTAVKIWMTIL